MVATTAPIAIPSPARAAASRANGVRSRGPASPETKAISRKNAVRHALTATICLPDEDGAEVAKRFDDLHAQFHPDTPMGKILVHRIAFLSVRLERCAEQEAAHLSEKIRHARDQHDEKCQLEVEALLADLGKAPATAVRRLLRTPEGTEALIRAWLDLREDLGRNNARFWTAAHCERANHLMGRRADEVPVSRINELSMAIWGKFGLLRPGDGEGLDETSRRAWAGQAMMALIDEEVEALRRCFEMLDHEGFALDREEAPKRALFDDSKAATLARRYEAAAERGMFRALNELRKVEKAAAEDPASAGKVGPSCQTGPSGSFFPAPEPPDEPVEDEERAEEGVVTLASPVPVRVEMGDLGGRDGATTHRHLLN